MGRAEQVERNHLTFFHLEHDSIRQPVAPRFILTRAHSPSY